MNVEDLQSTWEQLGNDDPLWAVLTEPAHKHNKWPVDEFLATGRRWVAQTTEQLDNLGLGLGDRVLDFGCGVGRLTQALAEVAGKVTGIDIAASMVEHAERLNQYPDRVDFVHYDGRLLPFADGEFDSVVSMIVIQHAPAAVQIATLVELQRVLRPGGVLVVQIPAAPIPIEPLPAEARRADLHVPGAPTAMVAGAAHELRVVVGNDGASEWPLGRGVRVGNHWRAGGQVVQGDDAREELTEAVAPGGSTEVPLVVTAPSTPGDYELEIDLVQETVTWFGDAGSPTLRLPVTVHAADAAGAEAAEPKRVPAHMSMTGMPLALVKGLFEHCGTDLVTALPDDFSGDSWESYTYVAQKRH